MHLSLQPVLTYVGQSGEFLVGAGFAADVDLAAQKQSPVGGGIEAKFRFVGALGEMDSHAG